MIKTLYGLSEHDYAEKLQAQGGVCAICLNPQSDGSMLCVDHCHATGRVRGLLCHKCNRALGFLKDDVNRLGQALRYLQRAGAQGDG